VNPTQFQELIKPVSRFAHGRALDKALERDLNEVFPPQGEAFTGIGAFRSPSRPSRVTRPGHWWSAAAERQFLWWVAMLPTHSTWWANTVRRMPAATS